VALNHFLITNGAAAIERNAEAGARSFRWTKSCRKTIRIEPADRLTAEIFYERRWALTLLEQVFLARLRDEYRLAGKVRILKL